MKKTIFLILVFVMILSLSVTAFAAGEDVTFSLTTEKSTVEVGDTITVSWAISTDQNRTLSVTDNYIYWDETVFKLVGAPVIESNYTVPKGQIGGYDADYLENTQGVKLIRCGTATNYAHTTTPSVIFTFQLEVIGGAGGTGRIWNDRSQAFDSTNAQVDVNAQNLNLTINRNSSDVIVTGVSVSPTEKTLTAAKETFTVVATVNPQNATNKGVRFTSDNTAVATVDETTGVVAAVSKGSANITVTTLDGSYTASCKVNVDITPEYTLTYVSNGGTNYPPEQYLAGTNVTLDKNPTRIDYAFTGWYLESDCEHQVNSVIVKKNMEVYAGWEFVGNQDPSDPIIVPIPNKSCQRDETCPMYPFTDLDVNGWYHDGVHFCIEEDLMKGMSTTEMLFSPGGTTTRAQIVTILWRMENEPIVNYLMQFEDVEAESWYTEAIRWAQSVDVVEGYGDTFGPNDPITREQMATILWRYCKYKGIEVFVDVDTNILSFEDALSVSNWATEAMQWACSFGMFQGIEKDGRMYLDPQGDAIRCQSATIIFRFCEEIAN